MLYRSDDPLRDLDRWLDEQDRREKMLPRCSECGDAIHDDYYYEIDGKIYCQKCLDENFWRSTEDYINDF